MQRSQTVREPRVLRALVSVQTQAKLLDATQPLKLRRVDQTNHQLAFGAVVAQRNDVVDRIAINSLGQALEPIQWIGPQSTTSRLGSGSQRQDSPYVTKVTRKAFTEFRTKTEFSDLPFARNRPNSAVFRPAKG